ncbi:MAG: hypothetical protein ACO27N_04060 [Bacteroidia bacterium]
MWDAIKTLTNPESIIQYGGIVLLALVIFAVIFHDGLGVGSNVPLYILAFVIVYKHLPNILRIIKGEEKKVI